MKRVVIIDDGYDHYEVEREILKAVGAEIQLHPCRGDELSVADAVRDADAVLVRESPITASALHTAHKLKGIVRYGIGVDNIDRSAAAERRIVVANVPDYGTEEVSDHTIALLLAVARRVTTRDLFVRGGGWFSGTSQKMYRIAGKTLGLIGYGRIARAVERKLRAFGVSRVLAFDPFATISGDVEQASLEKISREADFISLHLPLTSETRSIVNDHHIRLMKPTTIIINTSRGGLIDEVALSDALSEDRIFGAGLDVFELEPPNGSNALLHQPGVVVSDHAAWYSEESVADLQRKAAEEIARILSGQRPLHWVNPWETTN